MSTKSLIAIAASIAVVFLGVQGLSAYLHASCGQYHIFEPRCSKLLSTDETQAFLDRNQSVINELIQVDPAFISVSTREESRCPGKSMLVIEHPSERDCDALNEILHRDPFDIPYRIINY